VSSSLRVLIIEDSEDDAALAVRELQKGGYEVSYQRVDTPASMTSALDQGEWDVVISDHSMPNFSGIDALSLLRTKSPEMPFIFVSGTMGEEAAVEALKHGAQDYVMKGNLKRLVPAVRRGLYEVEQRRERAHLEHRLNLLERFEAIGRLAGGIAHDFNNVIGIVLGLAELGYEEASSDDALRERFRKIGEQAQRAAGLTGQLLAFARRQVLRPRRLNLNDSITQITGFLQTAIGDGIEVKTVLAPQLNIIRADPTHIDQILMNLCLNARDAMPEGGRLVIETRNVELKDDFCRVHSYGVPGNYVQLLISDSGTGMDEATLQRMFEPFFTTKELGRGTGLGLATVYGLVKQHEGFIHVYSEPGQGTTFHLYFPSTSGTPESREVISAAPVSVGTETILVAEDNEGLRELAHEVLSSRGYTVILASNGKEAIRLFKENRDKIQLALLDVAMPLLSGPELYTQIHALAPNFPAIFTTGYTAESASLESQLKTGAIFLQKPYSPQELGRAVRVALDQKRRTPS